MRSKIQTADAMESGGHTRSRWFRFLAMSLSFGASVALLLGTLAALNPALHLWLHSDATHPDHHCFAKLAEDHQLLAVDADIALAAPDSIALAAAPVMPNFDPSIVDLLLPPGRAPPTLAFSNRF